MDAEDKAAPSEVEDATAPGTWKPKKNGEDECTGDAEVAPAASSVLLKKSPINNPTNERRREGPTYK